jgi:hypothetical protein
MHEVCASLFVALERTRKSQSAEQGSGQVLKNVGEKVKPGVGAPSLDPGHLSSPGRYL